MKSTLGLMIIAVKPCLNCDKRYSKILKNEFYIFYQNYKEVKGRLVRKKGAELAESDVPKNFFNDNSDLHMSVSAIIGKNGDGKSTIVELIMRVLNNFAYVAGFTKMQSSLKPITGLCAELYYELNGRLYSIIVNNNDVTWKIPGINDITLNITNSKEENSRKLKDINLGEHFFYTQVSNYSLYAYNSNELIGESDKGEWIDGIFHKNDGYQTPIVLNPMRTEGNIDINTENELAKQRLISLLIEDESEDSFRTINGKQKAKAFQIKLFKETKLEQKTFLDFFRNYSGAYRQDYFPKSPNNKQSIESYIQKNILDVHPNI